jgi:hypothetical protein
MSSRVLNQDLALIKFFKKKHCYFFLKRSPVFLINKKLIKKYLEFLSGIGQI